MAQLASAFSNTTSKTEFDFVMKEEATKKTWSWDMIYGEMASINEYELKGVLLSGLGLPSTRLDGENIPSQDIEEMGTFTLSDVELALGSDYSLKFIEDIRQKGFASMGDYRKMMARIFGESYQQAYSVYAALPLNRAFDSTNQAMWDSLALCDSHVTKTGTSVDNDLPLAPHTFDTVWDMINFLRNDQYTWMDLRRTSTPAEFVFHPVHLKTYKKVFNQQWEPDSGDRNRNTIRDFNITPVECIELDDQNDKFLFGKEGKKNWVYKSRKKMTSVVRPNERNRTESIFTHARILVGVKDYAHFVGIPGT